MKKESAMISGEYADWLSGLSRRYRQSQIKAATAVNVELLRFYWSLGADIQRIEKDQPWGSGFMQKLSADLRTAMPKAKCFSERNLYYIRYFYELYSMSVISPQVEGKSPKVGDEFLPQVGAKLEHEIFRIPWGHHKLLIDKFRNDPDQALFYVRETLKNGWSRAVLLNFIDTDLYVRKGKAISNFNVALPDAESDLAQEITKDPYDFNFLTLETRYRESELKSALFAHIGKFLLELGQGFMYGNGDWETIRACHEKSMREAMGEVLAEREREKDEREAKGRDASSVRRDPPRSKADPGLKAPKGFPVELERGNPAVAERVLELLADGPMRPSALRKAVGIRSSIHFNRYYLSPLLEKGIIARTDPNHPQSPQQRYCLA